MGTVTTTITQSGPGTITDGAFSYSNGSTLAFTGAFDTPTTASGTYTLTNYPVTHGLPGPPYVHTDYVTHSGTWSATFAGTPPTYTLTYTAGPGGSISGSTPQVVAYGGSGTEVTAVPDAGYRFADWSDAVATASRTDTNVTQDISVTANFALDTLTISGTVTAGGTGLAGVTMAGLPGDPVTDGSGAYEATVSAGWSGTVTPTHAYYTFDPASITYTDVASDQTAQDYDATLIATADRRALIALYDSTNGDGWANNSGWKTPPLYPDGFAMPGTEGTWFGITVDGVSQRVTSISMEYGNMTGTIPAALADLSGLEVLDLGGNHLSGVIPSELGNLSDLRQLHLTSNPLTGGIPASLGSLTDLEELYLDSTALGGPIPPELGNLTHLIYLRINDAYLTGSIPAELGNLTNLRSLGLDANQLTGEIPASFGSLVNLEILLLYRNQLSGSIPPELGDLSSIRELYLGGNQLTGSIPAELGSLASLQGLGLYDNQLSGTIPAELGGLGSLRALRLYNNQLSGEIPAALGGLSALQDLSLNGNALTGAIPTELGSLANLVVLQLDNNHLTGTIPSELGGLSNLLQFGLKGNALTGTVPLSFVNLVSLYPGYVDLGYNALYTTDPDLVAFLNEKDPDWAATQTIAPTEVTATSLDNAVVLVSWLPIAYTGDPGHYAVLSSTTQGGPYAPAGQTADKSAVSLEVSGLTPGQRYYFVVQTHTDAHASNSNAVESESGAEATAVAWTQINVQISGTILAGGSPLANVLMAGFPAAVVTDASGVYSATVEAGWSGTITPTLEGYVFDPVSRPYSNITEDQTAQNYTATHPAVTISGTVTAGGTGLAGVTMTGFPEATITDGTGAYAAAVPYDWSGTVTPTHAYYTFDPVSRTYANVTASVADQDYAGSLIVTADRQGLIALYSSTNGDGWANNSGWKTPPLYPDGFALPGTEGTWFGITVDGGSQAVTKIYLNDNNLTGPLPSEIGDLAGLQELVLQTNHISGSLPASLGNLDNLGLLAIGYNDLSGTIPPELGNMASLWDLYLAHNHLSGSIPPELGSIPTLTQLYLDDNDLTGSIPAELGNLVDLEYLNLSENQLSGAIPAEVGNWAKMAFLTLSYNQLSGPIPAEFWTITTLAAVQLEYNQLTGSIPAEVGNLTHLYHLSLERNQLSGPIPAEFGNLGGLYYLLLNGNQLSGSIPASMGSMAVLERLDLDDNRLTGTIPAALASLTALSDFYVEGNMLAGPVPSELTAMSALARAHLGYNALYATDPDLVTFLNAKDPDWAATQTIAPTNVTATSLDNAVILVSWLPIAYTGDTGHYVVLSSTTSGGPYAPAGQTADKSATSLAVNGLTPGQRYYFVVQTHTDASANNENAVDSEPSAEATAVAWAQLEVAISGTVTLDGSPLAGVVMAGLTGSPATDASGAYAGTEAVDWSGTVTPTLAGYTFTPANRTYTNVVSDLSAQDYAAAAVVEDSITVVSPNGGENWYAGTAHDIVWTSTGTIPSVKIEYSTNGGTGWTVLAASTANTGAYPWTVPMPGTANALVRVSSASEPGIADASDAVFTVDTFTLTYAAGAGGTISGATPQEVAYGGSGTEVLAVPDAGYRFVNWSDGVPTASRTDIDVTADITVTAAFALEGAPYDGPWAGTNTEGRAVSFTVGSGGTAWSAFAYAIQFVCPIVGTVSTTITQSGPGIIAGGTFSYSNGSTLAFTGAFGSLTGASGTYTLTNYPVIHGLPGPPYVHTDYITYSGTWSATFAGTVPTITVTAPNGGESWEAGSTQSVTWIQTGMTGTATIDLYKGGVYQQTLATADIEAGAWSWAIAEDLAAGADYRVLIWQGGISDGSDADFEITEAPAAKDDFVGTWDGQGVYYRNSDTAGWVRLASPATMIAAGDLDGDGIDDLIGLWPTQGGIWVKYSQSGAWSKLSSTAVHIAAGDMNGDGREDLLGTWDGQGVYYRDSISGAWVRLASPATLITAGDIDDDGTDDLIGIWPAQGGVWVKYSHNGSWARLSSTARDIAAGDMNGDGRDDLLATWDGQGVYYRNSANGAWVRMASQAEQVTCGDVDADGKDDLIGIWPTQGGVWIKYSHNDAWALLSSTARDISAGQMRSQGALGAAAEDSTAVMAADASDDELPLPMGGRGEGPNAGLGQRDLSAEGPGGARFVFIEERDLVPNERSSVRATRIPGPGEPGFVAEDQKNLFPGEQRDSEKAPSKETRKKGERIQQDP